MKQSIMLFICVFVFSCSAQENTISKTKKEKQIITEVEFPKNEPDKIYLNSKHAFNYELKGNNFYIKDLTNMVIISGEIRKIDNEWVSKIQFHSVEKSFSNKKIIGRNNLIFALVESNVIGENFEIQKDKLLKFIEKFNEN